MNETREDTKFKKDLAEAMRKSTESFSQALEGISNSVMELGESVCRSIQLFSHAMINNSNQPPQPYHQNLFYQNVPHPYQTAPANAYAHSTPSRAANGYNIQNSQTAAGTTCGEANPSGAATH